MRQEHHSWTAQEIEFLKTHYATDGAAYCSKHLGLSRNRIKCMANSRMKLKVVNQNAVHQHWKGYKEISGTFFSRVIDGAKKRNFTINITLEQIWELFLKQNRRCAISGVELRFNSRPRLSDGNASLDRIDSSKGYTMENVQWIHKWVNIMKTNMSDKEFIDWCHTISDFNRAKILDTQAPDL